MVDRLTTRGMRALARRKYQAPEWLVLDEVGLGDGRSIDMLAMNLYASRGHLVIGIEIKVSRSDWLRELKDPSKADGVWKLCHQLYVAAPKDVVTDPESELPPGWGLLVPFGSSLTNVPARGGRRAEHREPDPMTRRTAVALVAQAFGAAPVSHETLRASMQSEYQRGLDYGRSLEAEDARRAKENLESHRATVAAFEAASGVRISQYDAGQIGEAVKLVTSSGGRGGDLGRRFWRAFLDTIDAAADLARAVAEFEGPPSSQVSYRGAAAEARARELYDRLREPLAEVQV